MKRIHIHVSSDDLNKSIEFYANLFGSQPTKRESDYAKWMLDDPKVNFAISSRGRKAGLDHFGIQVESAGDLKLLRQRLQKADMAALDEGETTCCYAKSDKTWVEDPGGIAWEAFRTLEDAKFFSEPSANVKACCSPETLEADAMGCC